MPLFLILCNKFRALLRVLSPAVGLLHCICRDNSRDHAAPQANARHKNLLTTYHKTETLWRERIISYKRTDKPRPANLQCRLIEFQSICD